MTSARFLFADSEVASVAVHGQQLRVRFAAAQLRLPDDTTLGDGRPVNAAGVELVLQGGPWTEAPGRWGRLSHGRLHDGAAWWSALPLPFSAPGPVRVELHFAGGAVLEAEATSARLHVPLDAAFIDSPAC